jgi:hypothetical protein
MLQFITPKILLLAILVGIVAAAFFLILRKRRSRSGQACQSGALSPSDEFQLLLNKAAPLPSAGTVGSKQPSIATTANTGLTAGQLLHEAKRLDSRNAGWPEILTTLNPSNNKTVADLLFTIRGPHMFAPGVAMQVIQAGCEDVISSNPTATSIDALTSARRSLDKIIRADRH